MSRYTVEGGGVGTLLVLVVILSKYRYKSEFNEWNEGGGGVCIRGGVKKLLRVKSHERERGRGK